MKAMAANVIIHVLERGASRRVLPTNEQKCSLLCEDIVSVATSLFEGAI